MTLADLTLTLTDQNAGWTLTDLTSDNMTDYKAGVDNDGPQ